MHMRISFHFLAGMADLHITRHARETDSEKHIRNIYTNLVKLNQLQAEIVIIDPKPQQSTKFLIYYIESTIGFVQGKPLTSTNTSEFDHQQGEK